MNIEEHLLVCLSEEAGELVQACSKAMRFGMAGHHFDSNITNRQQIEKEVVDLIAIVELLEDRRVIRPHALRGPIDEKKRSVLEWMEFSKDIGLVKK